MVHSHTLVKAMLMVFVLIITTVCLVLLSAFMMNMAILLSQARDDLDDGIAIDLAASVMLMPGLEARLGFVNDNGSSNDDVQQINGGLVGILVTLPLLWNSIASALMILMLGI